MHASLMISSQKTTSSTARTRRFPCFAFLLLCVALMGFSHLAMAHGDTAPQPVDTGNLPKLGEENWLARDPFATGEHREEAIRVGSRGYNANCARCHGLEVLSGGIAPDLRFLTRDCGGDEECLADMEGYYIATVRKGRVRDGRVYMPPFEGIMSQEAMWAIHTYIESRPKED